VLLRKIVVPISSGLDKNRYLCFGLVSQYEVTPELKIQIALSIKYFGFEYK